MLRSDLNLQKIGDLNKRKRRRYYAEERSKLTEKSACCVCKSVHQSKKSLMSHTYYVPVYFVIIVKLCFFQLMNTLYLIHNTETISDYLK